VLDALMGSAYAVGVSVLLRYVEAVRRERALRTEAAA
jgi:hypothetical protein